LKIQQHIFENKEEEKLEKDRIIARHKNKKR